MGSTTVLVVDDDMYVREVLVESLRERGHSVVAAGDGLEAVGVLRGRGVRVDLVVTDMEMPQMDGVALVRALVADSDLREVPIVLCSGRVDLEEVGAQLGVRTFAKSSRLTTLLDLVDELVCVHAG